MFSLPVLAALAVVAVVTSFVSGIFGMAGGMLLIGFLLALLPVPVAMVFHGVIQIAANGWRAWLWRGHVRWSVVLQFGAGTAASLAVFAFLDFVPDKALVLIAVGLTPFVALAVPQRMAPNIERRGQAFLAGAIGGAIQLVSGVTGPLLDIFYVRSGMTRQVNVATKAAAMVLGHLSKVAYFGTLIDNPAIRDAEQWLIMAYAAAFAVLGTNLSRRFLDRMSDRQFYHWTRRVILALGSVYVAQGMWLMVTR
ncbi:MAG: TSUP family transporter [Pseudomonadota bacterium]